MNKRNLWVAVGVPAIFLCLALATLVVLGNNAAEEQESAPPGDVSTGVAAPEPSRGSSGGYATGSDAYYGAPEKVAPLPTEPIPPIGNPTAGPTAAEVEQRIIKTGYLDLTVANVDETATKISAYAQGKGGFVQDTTVGERTDGTKYGSVTVRVPSSEFENAMTEIKTYATVVTTATVTGQDVTEQYADLQTQLANAEAQKAQYLEILKKATTVEEILMVQPYIDQATSSINTLKGQLQYLSNVTSFSTISISLAEEPTVRAPSKEFRPIDAAKAAVQALVDTAQALAIVLIWLVVLGGPIAIALSLLIWIVVKLGSKLMRR